MASAEQIAQFLHRHISARNDVALEGYPGWRPAVVWYAPRPAVDTLAAELLADAEFQALRLADLLNSPDGAVIETGVRLVIPATYTADLALFVEAMKIAARSQRIIGAKRAGLVALALVIIFALGLGD